jgi:hypothetical protein
VRPFAPEHPVTAKVIPTSKAEKILSMTELLARNA